MHNMERVMYLIIGCVLGFFVGYVVRSLRELKSNQESFGEHLDDIEKHGGGVKNIMTDDNDSDKGAISNDLLNKVALVLVVALTALSAFFSQRSSHDSQDALSRTKDTVSVNQRTADCTSKFFTATITALNARTQFSGAQSSANVDLQKAQAKFLTVFFSKPAPSNTQATAAYSQYFAALTHYITVSGQSSGAVAQNPYPSTTDYMKCLSTPIKSK